MEEEHCANNWDLHAVVRFGCRRAMSPPPTQRHDPFATFMPPPPVKEQPVDAGWCFPDLGAGFGQDADELLKAFCAPPSPPQLPLPLPPQQLPVSPPPPPPPKQQQQQQAMMAPAEVPLQTPAAPRPQPSGRQGSGGGVPRSKRRKNQQKKVVCHVAADGVSSDVWAWRKYGQKPIKGSPYPRGYYRCSTAKGCPARKQLERSRADPNTFILTFTGDHNHAAPTHRNSLAGTSRHKFPATSSSSSSSARPRPPPPSVVAAGEAHPSTSAGLSPTTPLRASSSSEDEDELLVEDMEMAGEDDLLFLSGESDNAATPLSSLFDVDEPFLGSPWTEMPTGAAGAAGS